MKIELLAIATFCASVMPVQADPFTQANTLFSAARGGRYIAPAADEIRRAEVLFLRLAKGEKSADVTAEAQALALDVRSEGTLTIVREHEDGKRGRGFFIFRRDARPYVLQVPHGWTDEMTEDIGMALFREGSFAAAVWNTVPRYYKEKGERIDADMAHLSDSYFSAFTRAAAQAWPSGQSLQIHGFEQGKRKSEAGAKTDMIISNGTRAPSENLRKQWRCLTEKLDRPIALYPDTVTEIGGTANVQGGHLRNLGYDGFIHLEMSHGMRRALRDDAATRAVFLSCLQP
ncbi:MAG: hypothetical protein V4568_09035 [Pseudomonadota bacterium]